MTYNRALITGGAGLIGSHIADLLVCDGLSEVIVLDDFSRGRWENLANAARSGKLTVVKGDIRDRLLVDELMKGIDVVFHQAALRITQCAEAPRLALEVLVDGSFNIFEAAVNAGVNKIVAASSASVYGLAETFPTDESHHGYNNRTLYGAAKLFGEGLLRSFHQMYGLNYIALRYFNVFGPRMDTYGAYTEVLIRWMERLAEDKPCLILGDGTQTMDFVFIEDVARANVLAAKSDVTDQVFNIASGTETSLNDLAAALGRAMGKDLRPQYGPVRKVNAVGPRLAGTEKAKRLLGFTPQFSLEEGLDRLVRWWEGQRVRESSAYAVEVR
jgi:UDP-glucose 4-epimerase